MGEWFDTGFMMADRKTVRSVYASSDIECEEFLKKGWKPVEKKALAVRRKIVKKVLKKPVGKKVINKRNNK